MEWEGIHVSLRRLLFDLVEEYGRHTGHADLLREAVDGVTGEDPPDGMPWPDRFGVRLDWQELSPFGLVSEPDQSC